MVNRTRPVITEVDSDGNYYPYWIAATVGESFGVPAGIVVGAIAD